MVLATAIITTFNRRLFFEQALKSVQCQTEKNIQILVLDNASTDGTAQYVRQVNDPRIQYIRHENMGISRQRNLGLKHSLGSYIGFLDDDDRWLPEKIQLQLAAFANGVPNLALVYGAFEFYNDEGKKWGKNSQGIISDYYKKLLWANDPFTGSASNPLLRKESVVALGGYNETIKVGEDWELYIRLAQNYPFQKIKDKLLEIRQHTGKRLGDRVSNALHTEAYVYRHHYARMNKALRSRYEQRIGGKLIRLCKTTQGRKLIKKALQNNILNVFAMFQLILSFTTQQNYIYFHRLYTKLLKKW